MSRREKPTDHEHIAHIIGQFFSCTLSKDGGGKITFEFGSESLSAIQLIQTWHNERPSNFAIAVKPLDN